MKGIFLNIDINTVTFPFLERVCAASHVKEEDLYPFVDQYAKTQITDIAFDIFCQISMTPSDAWSDVLDSYHRTEENGVKVDYKKILEQYHRLYEVHKLDAHAIWIRRCRDLGITPWLSIRMNDCHCPDEKTVWIRGSEFYEADEKGWKIGDVYGYQRHCYDYSVKEFSDRMLGYIEEQVMRYNADGLELDFSREWYCFREPDTPASRQAMVNFVRDVASILHRAEIKWGHPIRLHLRLMRDRKQNHALGFDIDAMVKESLLDSISVAPRWASCDSDMPIENFKSAYPDLPVYAGITDLTLLTPTDAEAAMGYAAAYLARGADKIYLYNFFSNPFSPSDANNTLYRTCGSLETLIGEARRIIVTYQDMTAWGQSPWVPLPAKADGFSLFIPTGPIAKEESISLVLGFDREITNEEVKVSLDGVPAVFMGMTEQGSAYAKGKNRTAGGEPVKALYLFTLPKRKGVEKAVTLSVEAGASLLLSYVEIIVKK